jgi:HK97 gp10 family phage protein
MAKTEIKMTGGPELERALRELGGNIAGRLGGNAVRAGARVIANEAKQRVPVRTGALRKSIRVFTERADRGGTVRQAWVGTRLFYSWFVEFGTSKQPPQPFLRPARDEGAQKAVDKIVENLSAGIERETQKYRGK